MKNVTRTVIAALFLTLLAACGTTRYIIATNDGTMIQAKGTPRLNAKTGMYEYKDLDGRPASIKQDQVKQVLER
jgi:uncharacterized lipoprotein